MNKSSFFIVGQHAVIEALRNPKRKVLRVFLTEESKKNIHRKNPNKNLLDDVKVHFKTKKELDKYSTKENLLHQGYVAEIEHFEKTDLKDFIKKRENITLACLDGVTDPRNIGSLIRSAVGDSAYNNWIKHLSFVSYENNTLSFSLPTKFLRDWIVNNYSDKIKIESKKYIDSIDIIKFVVKPNGGRVVPGTARTIKSNDNQWKSTLDIRSNQQSSYPNEFGAPLDPRFTFDNFVVGKPNELAFAASQRIAEADNVSFNPLFLYGGVGLGKTHLMHAMGWKIKELKPEIAERAAVLANLKQQIATAKVNAQRAATIKAQEKIEETK